MTQEELLERIAKLSITPETNVVPSELATALMAVVELHWHNEVKSSTGEVLETYCLECPNLSSYPCLTIQTIEKALL